VIRRPFIFKALFHMIPHVLINMAMTLDGKVSTVQHTGAVFTSRHDKRRLAEIRAKADALIMGANTVAIDRPRMGIPSENLRQERIARGQSEQPLRVILSASGSLSEEAKPFTERWSPILVFSSESAPPRWREKMERAVAPSGGKLFVMGKERVPLGQMLQVLGEQYNVRTALCEGGPTVNFQMIQEDLVDEIFITVAPLVFGGASALSPVEGAGFPPDQVRYATLISTENIEGEVFLHYRLLKGPQPQDKRWAPPAE
jgi:riboflavin-specific deaminase-like protein